MEYMEKQDIVDLAFYGEPAQEYNCYILLGEITERVARFNDYNEPMPWLTSQRYSISLSICAGVVCLHVMDLIDLQAENVGVVTVSNKCDDAQGLNEMLEMVIFLSRELTV